MKKNSEEGRQVKPENMTKKEKFERGREGTREIDSVSRQERRKRGMSENV